MTGDKLITSKDNSLIKQISALQKSAKSRRESGLFVLEGLRICGDACDNGIIFETLVLTESAEERYSEEVLRFRQNAGEVCLLRGNLFKAVSDTTSPQGVLAVCRMPDAASKTIDPDGYYIALENIADPSNLGAVARTAEALGVSGIILSGNGCDPYSPKALRASMGTLLRMPVFIYDDFTEWVSLSRLTAFGCVVDKEAFPIQEVKFPRGSLLIIGNEANGLTEPTKRAADRLITIPMAGSTESLNAATAAAICIWEMMKQK